MRRFLAALLLAAPLLLSGCASPPPAPASADAGDYWRGRLALRIDTAETSSFFASFELSGHPGAGELLLSSPLGSTLAQLRWNPQQALLRSNGETRAFDSLEALATEATGTAIPIAALFAWLRGQPMAADGWQADLSQLEQGRLLARRTQPAPAAELRLILEP
jgi:outer membrane lipoprotein LolB